MGHNGIVIFATQRCGSTLVCDDLYGTGVLGKPSEYYIYLLEQFKVNGSIDLKSIEDHLVNSGASLNGTVSIKVMASHLKEIDNLYEMADTKPHKLFSFFRKGKNFPYFVKALEESLIVHVKRNDKIAQAVSRVMAKKTNVYHLIDANKALRNHHKSVYKDRDEGGLEYNSKEITKELKAIRREEKILTNFFGYHRLKPFDVIYEDIINSREYVFQIAKRMRISDLVLKDRALKKISGNISKGWVDRYKKENITG